MKMKDGLDLSYNDVLIDPKVSTISSRFGDEVNPFYEGCSLPIVSAPMDSIFSKSFASSCSNRLFVIFSHRFQTIEQQITDITNGANGAVIGLNSPDDEIERYINAGAKHILIDVANGGNVAVREKLKSIQKYRAQVSLWAGNVANAECFNLIKFFCDYIRVGIASGFACSTATNTGISRGIISSIIDCRNSYNMSHQLSVKPSAKIVADGGIKTNGDICKALAAGAHLVMIGKLFASCPESCAPDKYENGIYYKRYRGMASAEVNKTSGKQKYSIEGESGWVLRSAPVSEFLDNLESNLRSSMSYVDAHNLKEFYDKTTLVKISQSVFLEKQTHFNS